MSFIGVYSYHHHITMALSGRANTAGFFEFCLLGWFVVNLSFVVLNRTPHKRALGKCKVDMVLFYGTIFI